MWRHILCKIFHHGSALRTELHRYNDVTPNKMKEKIDMHTRTRLLYRREKEREKNIKVLIVRSASAVIEGYDLNINDFIFKL